MIVRFILCILFIASCCQAAQANNDTLYYASSHSISNLEHEFITYNVDGFIPHPLLPYAFSNRAWIPVALPHAPSNGTSNKYFALSTSQYLNGVQSEDWLITKMINLPTDRDAILSWEAFALSDTAADGYEVRIFTSLLNANQLQQQSTLLLEVTAERDRPTKRALSLAAYRGESIYIAFVNKSVNKYLLAVHDILIYAEPDYSLYGTELTTFMPYSKVPFSQYHVQDFKVNLVNNGRLNLENIDVDFGVINHHGDTVYRFFQPNKIPFLAAGDSIRALNLGRFNPTEIGDYTFYYSAQNAQTSYRNTRRLEINNIFARCAAPLPEKSYSIGNLNNQYAVNFTLINREAPSEINVLISEGSTATHVTAYIYSTYADGSPFTLIAQTDTLAINNQVTSDYTLVILNPQILAAGNYAIAVEQIGGSIKMGFAYDFFKNNTAWFRVDNQINGWRALEDINPAYALSPMIYLGMSGANCTGMQVSINESNDSLHTEVRHATHPLRYSWQTGEQNSFIANPNGTYYYVTVTDALGCMASTYFTRTAVDEALAAPTFKIYPTPSDKIINIEGEWGYWSEKVDVVIYNATGQVILEKRYGYQEKIIDFFEIGNMAKGLYFIHLRTDKGHWIKKFIKY